MVTSLETRRKFSKCSKHSGTLGIILRIMFINDDFSMVLLIFLKVDQGSAIAQNDAKLKSEMYELSASLKSK